MHNVKTDPDILEIKLQIEKKKSLTCDEISKDCLQSVWGSATAAAHK